MAYNLLNQAQSSTLTDQERAAEAKRILTRIKPAIESAIATDESPRGWTDSGFDFACKMLDALELVGSVEVSVKQLFWLRDLSEKVD